MSHPTMVDERVHGETVWAAVRPRGADWSWLAPEERMRIGRHRIEQYGTGPAAAERILRHHWSSRKHMVGAPPMAHGNGESGRRVFLVGIERVRHGKEAL
jgi:hypothetical protein